MDSNVTTMDICTPRNAYLSAYYKRSFAYYTMKERVPVILTQTIDNLVRNKEEIGKVYGPEAQEELKSVIGDISKLKYELQTNKPLQELKSQAPDVQFYNSYLAEQTAKNGECNYFNVIWLYAECYVYRRLRETCELTQHLKNLDPFLFSKRSSFLSSIEAMVQLSEYLLYAVTEDNANKEDFLKLLKLNLWGNKCDLSISNGVVVKMSGPFDNLSSLDRMILCDHSEDIWEAISSGNDSDIIDIVFDNAGYELFTDLCLADFLVSKNLAKKIRLYVKSMPWFVSDVTLADINWTLNELNNNTSNVMRIMGERWSNYILHGTWEIVDDWFWTLPVDFTYMETVRPDLYKKLSEAKFVFFKGDLNYRKLFGEKYWNTTMSVEEAVQSFHPTKLGSLRTVKCHIIVGLKDGVAESLDKEDPKWMETGNYGLIQFSGRK